MNYLKRIKYLFVLCVYLPLLQPIYAQVNNDINVLVKFNDEVTSFSVQGVFVLPGEQVKIEPLFEGVQSDYSLKAHNGTIEKVDDNNWVWTAPLVKGVYPVVLNMEGTQDSILLNCIVMVPFKDVKGGSLNGYAIGDYPHSSNKLYALPKGFIEVTKDNEHTLVTPHYKLKDFLCKQSGGYPKYVTLKERGIIKLETIQDYLKAEGLDFEKFSFISGYRTPTYNKAIGNVKNSRHIFGDAYDVFIDKDGDGRMDDLNKDGVLNKKDARVIYNMVNAYYNYEWYKPFIGGLGLYGPNSRHGGFIHLDSRGYRARWGS